MLESYSHQFPCQRLCMEIILTLRILERNKGFWFKVSISLLKIACMGHQIAGFYSPGLFSRSTAGEVAVEQSGAGRGAEWSRSWSRVEQVGSNLHKMLVLCCGLIFFVKKIYKKKLKFKSSRSFCKAIPKSIGYVYNVWSKSNIYNINNNIKLAWPKFKWVWLQHKTQSLGCGSSCKVVS